MAKLVFDGKVIPFYDHEMVEVSVPALKKLVSSNFTGFTACVGYNCRVGLGVGLGIGLGDHRRLEG